MSEADRQDMLSMKPIRIGILFNKKKRANLGDIFKSKYKIQHPLTQQSIEVDVILVDDAEHLRAMSPLDILLLKLTDLQTAELYSNDEDTRMKARVSIEKVSQTIEEMNQRHALTAVHDFKRVQVLLNRAAMQKLLGEMDIQTADGVKCNMPAAFLYQPSKANTLSTGPVSSASISTYSLPIHHSLPSDLSFPIICKSVAACGTAASHCMYVLQRPEDLVSMEAHEQSNQPVNSSTSSSPIWLIQKYINHGGRLYKVYVLDQDVYVHDKPSLPDLTPDASPYYMNSQDMTIHPLPTPSSSSSSSTSSMLSQPPLSSASSKSASSPSIPASVYSIARHCAEQLRQRLQLSLFGFDLIRHTPPSSTMSPASDSYYIIDVNYFPSFKSVEQLDVKIINLCLRQHAAHSTD